MHTQMYAEYRGCGTQIQYASMLFEEKAGACARAPQAMRFFILGPSCILYKAFIILHLTFISPDQPRGLWPLIP